MGCGHKERSAVPTDSGPAAQAVLTNASNVMRSAFFIADTLRRQSGHDVAGKRRAPGLIVAKNGDSPRLLAKGDSQEDRRRG